MHFYRNVIHRETTSKEQICLAGISVQIDATDPAAAGAIIAGIWGKFFSEGMSDKISNKKSAFPKHFGVYTK